MKNNLKKNLNVYSTCFLAAAILGVSNLDNSLKPLGIKSPITVSHAAVQKDKYGVTIGGRSVNSGNTKMKMKKNVVVRKGTSSSSASVCTLKKNTSVKVTHMTSSWARVQFSSGKTGWIPLSSGQVYMKTTVFSKIKDMFANFGLLIDRTINPNRKWNYRMNINTGTKYLLDGNYNECILEFNKDIKITPAPKGYKKPTSYKGRNSLSFTDLESHWAKGELEHYIDLDVISADSLDKVNPDRAITRGEFASIVNKGFGLNVDLSNPDKNIERKEAIDILINTLNADALGLNSVNKDDLYEGILDVLVSTDTAVFETEEEVNSAPITKAQIANLLYNLQQKPTEEESIEKMIIGNSVRFRKGPSTNDAIIKNLSNGTTVTVLDESNKNWTLVQYQDTTGYVASKYLSGIDKIKTVTNNSVRFRKGPSTNSAIIESLNQGTVVSVLDDSNGSWTKIQYRDNTGYIFSDYLG